MKAERINLETEFLADIATNNGFVVECEETAEDIIKNIVSYIIILIKQ